MSFYFAEELAQMQKDLQFNIEALQDDVIVFIEHQASVNDTPHVPSFFIHGFNVLKEECDKINYMDATMDTMHATVATCLLNESGDLADFPEMDANGLLVDKLAEPCMKTEVARLFRDLATFIRNHVEFTGKLPFLPHAFLLSVTHFQQLLDTRQFDTLENRHLVDNLLPFLQQILEVKLDDIPPNYVNVCVEHLREKSD